MKNLVANSHEKPPAKSPSLKAASTIGVSIVEDDAPAARILADWVGRTKGFRYISDYRTTELAVSNLAKDKPDVVLTDINLPGLSGIECVRRLKPVLPNTQFVMLTVYEDSDHIFNALVAGATGYLLKQTPREDLIDALKEVSQGGSPMTSNIARKVVQSFQSNQPQPQFAEMEGLSPREKEVLDLLARGFLYKEIGDALGISVPTVNTYIRRVYEKLHVRSRAQAVAKYAHIPS